MWWSRLLGWTNRRKGEIMPDRFHELAEYNRRVSQGIVHTEEMRARMFFLQGDFDQWVSSPNDTGQAGPGGSKG
jgi:hypothetical protein